MFKFVKATCMYKILLFSFLDTVYNNNLRSAFYRSFVANIYTQNLIFRHSPENKHIKFCADRSFSDIRSCCPATHGNTSDQLQHILAALRRCAK